MSRQRCYLCVLEGYTGAETWAEGRCETCRRPVCWPHGATETTLPGSGAYYCSSGDLCPSGRHAQCYRQKNIIHGLLGGWDDYPRENLQELVEKHMQVWEWMVADGQRYHWLYPSAQDKRDMLRAVTIARRLLGLPAQARPAPVTAAPKAPVDVAVQTPPPKPALTSKRSIHVDHQQSRRAYAAATLWD